MAEDTEKLKPASPLTLTERVNALTEVLISLTRFRDEAVANLAGLRQAAEDHANTVVDAAARNIEKNNRADIAQRAAEAAAELAKRFESLTRRQQAALSSRADAIEARVMAERQKAVTLADVRPKLEELVASAIEARRVELDRGDDERTQKAVKLALEKVDIPFSSLTFRGTWDPAVTYPANDVVYYRGGSWVALRSTKQVPAPKSPDWQQLSAPGARGPEGPPGPSGPTGIESLGTNTTLAPTHAGKILRLTSGVALTVEADSLPAAGAALAVAEASGCTIVRGSGVEFVSVEGDSDLSIVEGGTAGIACLESGVYVVTGDIGL